MRIAVLALAVLAVAIVPALAADQTVVASSNVFDDDSVTVNQGETVTWTSGGGSHTVHFLGEAGLGSVGTNTPSKTFPTIGTFKYYCDFHGSDAGGGNTGGMDGQVTVVASGAPSPTPSPTVGATPTPTPTVGSTPTAGATPTATPKPGTTPTATPTPVLVGGTYVLPSFSVKAARRACVRPARRCRRPGLRLVVRASAPFTVTGTLFRGTRRFGTLRVRTRAGTRTVRVLKVASGKRLRAGRYRLVMRGAGLTRTVRFSVRSK